MAGIITALKIQKKNPQRVNVYLDGEFAFGLSKFVAAWLHTGQILDDSKIAELIDNDQFEIAYQRVLKYINFRERSTQEVRQYLHKLQLSEALIKSILDRLAQVGLLDDLHFAKTWVEQRSEFRPRSMKALSFELRQHGISDKIIHSILGSVDEKENAYKAAKKQALKYTGMEWQEFRNKIYIHLTRNGFRSEVIPLIIKQIWEENNEN